MNENISKTCGKCGSPVDCRGNLLCACKMRQHEIDELIKTSIEVVTNHLVSEITRVADAIIGNTTKDAWRRNDG